MDLQTAPTAEIQAELARRETERRQNSKKFTMDDDEICAFSYIGNNRFSISTFCDEEDFEDGNAEEYIEFNMQYLSDFINTVRSFQNALRRLEER